MRKIMPWALALVLGVAAFAVYPATGLAHAEVPPPTSLNLSNSSHATPRHLPGPHSFPGKGKGHKTTYNGACSPMPCGSGDLLYNGGPVQANPAAYVILWGSGWSTSTGTGKVIYNYFHDVGHTAFENTITQYYDGTQAITNSLSLGGVWVDTSMPPTETTNCSGVPAVDDSSLQTEVQHAISVNGWADDPKNATYFVYTPSGDAIWQSSLGCSTLASGGQFCAYHSYFLGVDMAHSFAYGAMPWPDNNGNPLTSFCPALEGPNGDTAGDSEVNLTSHEQIEAMTDPQLNAWFDSAGYEIGDKCAWVDNGTTSLHNGDQYWMQPGYSNLTHSCLNYSRTWYFAEGTTKSGFTTYLTIANGDAWPNQSGASANVVVEYLLGSGSPIIKNYTVNANTRSTLNINTEVGANNNVSMVVFSDQPIVAERPMYFTYSSSPPIPGGTDTLGANQPDMNFDFGYLDTTSNHVTYLTILNQNQTAITATIRYFPASGGLPTIKTHTINATSRGTINVNTEGLSTGSYSALVSLSLPGMVERPMYLVDSVTGQTGAADVVGMPTTFTSWNFAEGFTGTGFSERYILSNPTTASTTAHATITYFESNGTIVTHNVTLNPGQQQIIDANTDLGSGISNSATVTSDNPILAERFMSFLYTGFVTGSSTSHIPGASDVLGMPSTSTSFQFAEGTTIPNFAEYLTLQNPGASAVTVTITYLPNASGSPTVKSYVVNAHSRATVETWTDMPSQSFSAVVTAPSNIVAERPMYFNYAGIDTGGSDVIGYVPAPAN